MVKQAVQCPRCESWNPLKPVQVYGRVNILSFHGLTYQDAFYPLYYSGSSEITVIECAACGRPFVAIGSGRQAQAVWPLPHPSAPEGVPDKVSEAYCDAMKAFAAGSKIGALMAGRTALERMPRDKGVSRYQDLVEKGVITPALYGAADQLRLWATVLAHEDIPAGAADKEDVEQILVYLRTVLEAVYTHQSTVDRLVARRKQLTDKASRDS